MNTRRANVKLYIPLILAILIITGGGLYFLFAKSAPVDQPLPPEEWDAVTKARVLGELEIADEAVSSGQLQQGEEIAKRIYAEQPLDPRALRILIRIEKRRSISSDPPNPEFLNNAIAYARKALELKPQDPEYHYGLAHLLSESGDLNGALTHFLKSYELQPDDHRFSFYSARVYHGLKQFKEAEDYYLLSLKANDSNHQTYEGLALMAVEREDYLEAAKLLKEAMALLPDAQTDSQTAFEERKRYLPAYGLARARFFIKGGQPQSALQTLALLPRDLPAETRKEIFILTAEAYEADGQFKNAAEMWAEISSQQRLDAVAAARAGIAYFKLGEIDLAKGYLKIAWDLKDYDPVVQELNDMILDSLEEEQKKKAPSTQPQ